MGKKTHLQITSPTFLKCPNLDARSFFDLLYGSREKTKPLEYVYTTVRSILQNYKSMHSNETCNMKKNAQFGLFVALKKEEKEKEKEEEEGGGRNVIFSSSATIIICAMSTRDLKTETETLISLT